MKAINLPILKSIPRNFIALSVLWCISIGSVHGGGQVLSCQYPGADPWRCRADRNAIKGEAIAVIYPEVGEPESTQYAEVIKGVEQQTKTAAIRFPVGANQNGADLAKELHLQNINHAIVLGRNGVKAINVLDRDTKIVIGSIITAPEAETRGNTVHSIAPDPYLLFALLKTLIPGAHRVFVVYDPTKNEWLIRLAREAAKNLGLELVAQEATDIKTAMNLYLLAIGSADTKRDAIWLPQDLVTVDETLVLPTVLRETWNRNLIVFSSNASLVKQGVLFSLYPDYRLLGRKLATAVLNSSSSSERNIIPLKEVRTAVNTRTAKLLGLNISQVQFDQTYPEQ